MKRHVMSTLGKNWRSSRLWHLPEKNVGVVSTFIHTFVPNFFMKIGILKRGLEWVLNRVHHGRRSQQCAEQTLDKIAKSF